MAVVELRYTLVHSWLTTSAPELVDAVRAMLLARLMEWGMHHSPLPSIMWFYRIIATAIRE